MRLAILLAALLGSSAHAHAHAHAAVRVRPVTRPGLHTECPVWYAAQRGLLFVDIAAQRLHFYEPRSQRVHEAVFGGPVAPVRVLRGDDLVLGVGRQVRLLDWAAFNFSAAAPQLAPPRVLADVDANKPGNRLNDGNVDRRGRIWFGTMGPEPVVGQVQPDQGALYRITERGGARAELARVSISNGLVWDAAETLMYYIDTPTRRVDVFDYDAERGSIANRRPAFDLAAHNVTGNPDGMAVDADGNLWVACFGGGQVIHVDPRPSGGRLLRRVAIPASQVTAVALGEPRDAAGDTLYVTSMRRGLSPEQLLAQPDAGAVFAVTGLGVARPD